MKILSKSSVTPTYIKRGDNTYTDSSKEVLELLMDTHFPGSTPVNGLNHDINSSNLGVVPDNIVNQEKIRWAINGFKPFKSPGPMEFSLHYFSTRWIIVGSGLPY